jgi:hypothetical protein
MIYANCCTPWCTIFLEKMIIKACGTSWNPEFHYCVHKGLLLILTLSHMNPHHFTPCFPKIHFSIIILSTHRSPKLSLPMRSSIQNFVYSSQLPMHTMRHLCHILLDLIALTVIGEEDNYEVPHYVIVSSLLLHPLSWVQMFSDIFKSCAFLRVRNHILCSYYRTGKIIVLYI